MASLTIALDAMGGDFGPRVIIPGAHLSLVRHSNHRCLLFGDEPLIRREVEAFPDLAERCEIIHTDDVIAMDVKPGQALRKGRKSSMWHAIEAVKEGRADAVLSAGNTGALMALSKFSLRTMPGIERPAIAAIWPTIESESIVLDVGANIGATVHHLFDFALMGAAMAKALYGRSSPKVGLLNIGVEDIKGHEEIKHAGAIFRDLEVPFDYYGFVEGDDLGQGIVDVIVTEGFTGNIALKTAEGTARQISEYLRAAMSRSLMSRIGAFFAQGAFRILKEKMNPSHMNGGVFLGLNGIVIKSHGSADSMGFASAIDLGFDMVEHGLMENISKDVERLHAVLEEQLHVLSGVAAK